MSVELQELVNFHLTGRGSRAATASAADADWIPALLAPYRDLSRLRYDFPMVLVDGPDSQAFIDTLTGIVNRLLRDIAPAGNAGEQLRQDLLLLERRMRELAADAVGVSLTELWKRAEKSLLGERDGQQAEWLGNSIATARFALRVDGEVVDCNERLPARLIEHGWSRLAGRRPESTERINRLIIRLRNVLKVDDLKNGASRTPQKLKTTLGKRYREAFDFERMAEVLDDSTPHNRLPALRRKRIRKALSVLESQRFFPTYTADGRDKALYEFRFDNLSAALKAYKERLSDMVDVIRAIAIAELELENAYSDERHADYFSRFGPQALSFDDLALFPSYLVSLHDSDCNSRELAQLMEVVTCDLPMKVLIQVSDPVGEVSPRGGHSRGGSFVQQLVSTFIAGDAYILQSSASHVFRQREQLRKALEFRGPAIFSVFAPFADACPPLPDYFVAAAAVESRAFPVFSYDPSAGTGLADRFDISGNPALESDWPRRQLRYEDKNLQAVVDDAAFTVADFALTDRIYSDHFAFAGRLAWHDGLVPVADYIDCADTEAVRSVPFIPVVTNDNSLQRLVVDEQLIRLARRCRERWHALQELGGVHNSYASAAAERADREAPPVQALAEASGEAAASSSAEDPATELAAAGSSGDEAYIETPRCTTCDECTRRNDRMFAYDENKQAFITDPDAGTYRELVEAAETCQVAIIHPGMPRNPQEPGLDELIERARPFNG